VSKDTTPTKTAKAVYQDKRCILFSGTVVTVGRGRAVVVAVGSNTGIGKIRGIMTEAEGEMTPLKKKLDEFGTFLSKVSGSCSGSLAVRSNAGVRKFRGLWPVQKER
jgi:Ca2+ transporting ATPase